MIALIVNADDLGSNPNRDRGIMQAFYGGIVSSASLLANGDTFYSAAKLAKEAQLPVGVHLNLADGRTLTGPIAGLTDNAGQLPGKRQLRQCLVENSCDKEAIRRELAAQIERLLQAGLQPDHLDGHQHCQLFPCLTGTVTELAREYGLSAMRAVLPGEAAELDPAGALGEEMALYRQLGRAAQASILEAGLKTPDGLWGLPLLNRLNLGNLCQLLESIPPGYWEVMTHPGYCCRQGGAFDGAQRQIELEALCSAQAREIVARRKIRLCSFGDLPCVS